MCEWFCVCATKRIVIVRMGKLMRKCKDLHNILQVYSDVFMHDLNWNLICSYHSKARLMYHWQQKILIFWTFFSSPNENFDMTISSHRNFNSHHLQQQWSDFFSIVEYFNIVLLHFSAIFFSNAHNMKSLSLWTDSLVLLCIAHWVAFYTNGNVMFFFFSISLFP